MSFFLDGDSTTISNTPTHDIHIDPILSPIQSKPKQLAKSSSWGHNGSSEDMHTSKTAPPSADNSAATTPAEIDRNHHHAHTLKNNHSFDSHSISCPSSSTLDDTSPKESPTEDSECKSSSTTSPSSSSSTSSSDTPKPKRLSPAELLRFNEEVAVVDDDLHNPKNIEELNICKSFLFKELKTSSLPPCFTDYYLLTVLKNRTRLYGRQKLLNCLLWRKNFYNRLGIQKFIEDFESKSLANYNELSECISSNSLYWYGYDIKSNTPILYVKPSKKNWKALNINNEILMHVLLLEKGLEMLYDQETGRHLMNPLTNTPVTTFTIIAEGELAFQSLNTNLMKSLINILTVGYPDRLHLLYVGPSHFFLRGLFKLLKPLLPGPIVKKVIMMGSDTNEKLKEILDEEDIPVWMKGSKTHTWKDHALTCDVESMLEHQTQCLNLLLDSQIQSKVSPDNPPSSDNVDL